VWVELWNTSNFNSRDTNADKTKPPPGNWEPLIVDPRSKLRLPQGLKPASLLALGAAAEAAPFQNDLLATTISLRGEAELYYFHRFPGRGLVFPLLDGACQGICEQGVPAENPHFLYTSASTCTVPVNFMRSAMAGYSGGELRSSRRAASTGEDELANTGEEVP